MLNEQPQSPQSLTPNSEPEGVGAFWHEREEWKALRDQYRKFVRIFLDLGGDYADFWGKRLVPRLKVLVAERGLSPEKITDYAAYHAILGSSTDLTRCPEFDTPDKIIEESLDELCAEELGRLAMEKN